MPPLHLAAYLGESATVLDRLDVWKDNIDSRSMMGTTALMFATEKQHYDVIKLLVDRRANLNLLDYNNKDVLSMAMEDRDHWLIDYFLTKGSIPDPVRHAGLLIHAVRSFDFLKVKTILYANPVMIEEETTMGPLLRVLFHKKVSPNSLKMLDFLLEKGADPSLLIFFTKKPFMDRLRVARNGIWLYSAARAFQKRHEEFRVEPLHVWTPEEKMVQKCVLELKPEILQELSMYF